MGILSKSFDYLFGALSPSMRSKVVFKVLNYYNASPGGSFVCLPGGRKLFYNEIKGGADLAN